MKEDIFHVDKRQTTKQKHWANDEEFQLHIKDTNSTPYVFSPSRVQCKGMEIATAGLVLGLVYCRHGILVPFAYSFNPNLDRSNKLPYYLVRSTCFYAFQLYGVPLQNSQYIYM